MGTPPTLFIIMETVKQYGCGGESIDHVFSQHGDTLRVSLHGVRAPTAICMDMVDAARLRLALPKRMGRFVVLVDRGAASDEMALQVSQAEAVVSAVRTSFIDVDEEVWWRYPDKSFAYFCDNTYWPVCDEVERWLVDQKGVTMLHFPAKGHNSKPDSFADLGHTTLSLPHDSNINRWLGSISDDGPNNGYSYMLDLPPVTTSVSQVNTKAISDTSSFYRVQEARRKKIGNDWYCAKSVVWPGVLYSLSVKHEGAVSPYPSPDTIPNSHPGIFRRHVDSLAFLRYEPIVSFGGQDNASPVTSALFTESANDSNAMDHDSLNYVNHTSLGNCDHFHFGPYP